MDKVNKIYSYYSNFKPFTDNEAWFIFRVAAFGEAIGWTLLITGIAIQYLIPATGNIPVEIAGHLHGVLFMIYIVLVLVAAPSMRWSFKKILVAAAFSVPPYGTLMYEIYENNLRKFASLSLLYYAISYVLLVS